MTQLVVRLTAIGGLVGVAIALCLLVSSLSSRRCQRSDRWRSCRRQRRNCHGPGRNPYDVDRRQLGDRTPRCSRKPPQLLSSANPQLHREKTPRRALAPIRNPTDIRTCGVVRITSSEQCRSASRIH